MRYRIHMRTTLELDDDIVLVAKQIARQRSLTMGQVISDLARQSLESSKSNTKTRNGVPLFTPKSGAKRPSLALVNKLRNKK